MHEYIWTRLIRIECEYREFNFNVNHNLNLCVQAFIELLLDSNETVARIQGRLAQVLRKQEKGQDLCCQILQKPWNKVIRLLHR